MVSVRVKINSSGARSLLRSPAVAADLEGRAEAIAAAAGDPADFRAVSEIGPNRARAAVHTASIAGIVAEARDHRLLTALNSGRS